MIRALRRLFGLDARPEAEEVPKEGAHGCAEEPKKGRSLAEAAERFRPSEMDLGRFHGNSRDFREVFPESWARIQAEKPALKGGNNLKKLAEDLSNEEQAELVEMRGGCKCHDRPPCGAHTDPLTFEEAEELGLTVIYWDPAGPEGPGFP